jgi:hypothetical protein
LLQFASRENPGLCGQSQGLLTPARKALEGLRKICHNYLKLWNAQNGRAVLLADLEILNLENRLLSEAAPRLEIRGVRFSRKVVSKKCLLPTIKGWSGSYSGLDTSIKSNGGASGLSDRMRRQEADLSNTSIGSSQSGSGLRIRIETIPSSFGHGMGVGNHYRFQKRL